MPDIPISLKGIVVVVEDGRLEEIYAIGPAVDVTILDFDTQSETEPCIRRDEVSENIYPIMREGGVVERIQTSMGWTFKPQEGQDLLEVLIKKLMEKHTQ